MRGLHARFSDVHAFSAIVKNVYSVFCASCGILHYSASSTLYVDLSSPRSIMSNKSMQRCTRFTLGSTTDLTNYEINSA